MVSKTIFSDVLSSLKPASYCPPIGIDTGTESLVFILCAFLKRSKVSGGPVQHLWIREFLETRADSESDLRNWIEARSGRRSKNKSWEACRKQADGWQAENIRIVRLPTPAGCSLNTAVEGNWVTDDKGVSTVAAEFSEQPVCPSVLFVRGSLNLDFPWLAVFNSRKPRSSSPDAGWLNALRTALNYLRSGKVVFATGIGTLTYDMVGVYASGSGLPFVVTAPFSILEPNSEISDLYGECTGGFGILSCLADTNACSKKTRLVCRDRLLTALSQAHLVLEIRSGGNLASVLNTQQQRDPRVQFIYEPGGKTSANAGNYSLLNEFPESSRGFRLAETAARSGVIAEAEGDRGVAGFWNPIDTDRIDWREYLFHYTRACPGPWPGESQREYLLNLLSGEVPAGHSALDTLVRILKEGRIRAGTKLVRGNDPVISWSSHSPQEMFILRKWNPALVRWTVEPYGMALRRDYLRSLGARPAVYGADSMYLRLPESERHRFQLSGESGLEWRHEREWRLLGDLILEQVREGKGFIFVPTRGERDRVLSRARPALPVIAFEESANIRD
jgi:hypothetical protein